MLRRILLTLQGTPSTAATVTAPQPRDYATALRLGYRPRP